MTRYCGVEARLDLVELTNSGRQVALKALLTD